jgi:hypothetical protein
MTEENDNQIEHRSAGRIGRQSDLARRGMNAFDYVRGLAARLQQTTIPTDAEVIGVFKQIILEALDLLKSSQPEEAAFKIGDAMLHLPPEKRITRGGIAEWGLEWCQGHLTPIRVDGGFLCGPPVINDRDLSNVYNIWGIEWDHYELLISEILNGNILHPYLPDDQNPQWRPLGDPTDSDANSRWAPRSLITAILILMRLSEDTLNLSPHHPRLNLALGLIHASLAYDQQAYKGIHAVIDGLRSRVPPVGESLYGGLDRLDDFFNDRKGGCPPFSLIPEETWDLITIPYDRAEWARRNDEMAVRYLSEAILYSPYQTMFHIHMALGVCLTRLGRSDAEGHFILADYTETVRPRLPVPMEDFPLEIVGANGRDEPMYWLPYGSDIEEQILRNWLGDSYERTVLTKKAITIGRSKDNDITLPDDPLVSSRHAELSMEEDGVIWIKDLDSTNGTYLNDEELTTHHSERRSKAPVPLFITEYITDERSDILGEESSDAISWSWPGEGRGSEVVLGKTRLGLGGHQSAGMSEFARGLSAFTRQEGAKGPGQSRQTQSEAREDPHGHPHREDYGFFPGWCCYWGGVWDSRLDGRLDRLMSLKLALDELASGNSEAALVNINKAIEAHEEESLPVPFELYHLRSEIYLLLGNHPLAENDRRLADQVLALEFSHPKR